jgi:hypothetical protein
MILLVIIVLAISGAIATQIRHASATPADKTACSSTLGALSNQSPTQMAAMLHDLEFANDKTLLGARGDMTGDIAHEEPHDLVVHAAGDRGHALRDERVDGDCRQPFGLDGREVQHRPGKRHRAPFDRPLLAVSQRSSRTTTRT